jgi:hypothetical protein
LIVNGLAFGLSLIVTFIFVGTEFTSGAWAVVVVIPLIVFTLSRTHKRYVAEKGVLAEEGAPAAVNAPMLRHHVVLLLVDRVDLATARALQLARSLSAGNELRAIHFMTDEERSARLSASWRRLGLDKVSLEMIECPDRRLVRAATEMADDLASDGQTEVLMVLPRRAYRGLASRVLHDHTADRIVAAVTQIPNVSATIAPFDVQRLLRRRHAETTAAPAATVVPDLDQVAVVSAPRGPESTNGSAPVPGTTPLGEVVHRQRTKVAGRVRSVRVQPWSGVSTFECTLVDGSGALTVVFLGRRAVAGVEPGVKMVAEGTIGNYQGHLAMLNPTYEFLVAGEKGRSASA